MVQLHKMEADLYRFRDGNPLNIQNSGAVCI